MSRLAFAPLVLAALLATGPAGCTARHVEITVDRPDSLSDTVLDIQVTGLAPGGTATVGVQAPDVTGLRWSAAAQFVAGAVQRGALRLPRP